MEKSQSVADFRSTRFDSRESFLPQALLFVATFKIFVYARVLATFRQILDWQVLSFLPTTLLMERRTFQEKGDSS